MTPAEQQRLDALEADVRELQACILKSFKTALPALEAITGKDLLHDEKFNEAMEALAQAFVDAPEQS